MSIIEGVPHSHQPPPSVGQIPIEATDSRELRTADLGSRELLSVQVHLLHRLLCQMRLNNETLFPTENWDNERQTAGDAVAAGLENLPIS